MRSVSEIQRLQNIVSSGEIESDKRKESQVRLSSSDDRDVTSR